MAGGTTDSPIMPCPLRKKAMDQLYDEMLDDFVPPPPPSPPPSKLTLSCCHGRICPEHTEDNVFEVVPSTDCITYYRLTETEGLKQGIIVTEAEKKWWQVWKDTELGEKSRSRYKYVDAVTAVWTGPNIPSILHVVDDKGKYNNVVGSGNYKLEVSVDPADFDHSYKDGKVERADFLSRALDRFSVRNKFKEYKILDVPPGYSPITVRVYNPEKFTLTFCIPPLKGYSSGNKLERVDGKVKMEETARVDNSIREMVSNNNIAPYATAVESAAPKIGAADNVVPPKDEDKTDTGLTSANNFKNLINIEKEGVEESGVVATAKSVLGLVSSTYQVFKSMPSVPSMGFYVDLQMSILQGEMKIKWGWKEEGNGRALYYETSSGKLVIFSLALEFGFGLSMILIKAQLFARCKGEICAEGNFNFTYRSNDKEANVQLTGGRISISGKIGFCIGFRFDVFACINIELTLNTDLETTGAFTVDDYAVCKMQVDRVFTGIYAKIDVGVGILGAFAIRMLGTKEKKSTNVHDHNDEVLVKDTSSESRYQLYPSKRLSTYRFPSSDDTESLKGGMKERELAQRMQAMLRGEKLLGEGGKIIVRGNKYRNESHESWLVAGDKDAQTSEIDAYKIADMLSKKAITKNIDFTADGTVELLLLNIRKGLQKVPYVKTFFGIGDGYYMYDDVTKFINGGAYDKILKDNEDPILDLAAKSS